MNKLGIDFCLIIVASLSVILGELQAQTDPLLERFQMRKKVRELVDLDLSQTNLAKELKIKSMQVRYTVLDHETALHDSKDKSIVAQQHFNQNGQLLKEIYVSPLNFEASFWFMQPEQNTFQYNADGQCIQQSKITEMGGVIQEENMYKRYNADGQLAQDSIILITKWEAQQEDTTIEKSYQLVYTVTYQYNELNQCDYKLIEYLDHPEKRSEYTYTYAPDQTLTREEIKMPELFRTVYYQSTEEDNCVEEQIKIIDNEKTQGIDYNFICYEDDQIQYMHVDRTEANRHRTRRKTYEYHYTQENDNKLLTIEEKDPDSKLINYLHLVYNSKQELIEESTKLIGQRIAYSYLENGLLDKQIFTNKKKGKDIFELQYNYEFYTP
ncbi:MAG: hypothetical protein MK212_15865 [Saprospiraceae bacterium]|nr:hypothetical protein [Saprospiraceae bacterium]